MRHGILAFVGVLTLICLAVGDEPKRLDDQVADETDEGRVERVLLEQDRTDLDIEIEKLQVKLEQLAKQKRRAEESGAKHELAVLRETITYTERRIDKLQAERRRRSGEPDESSQHIEHIRIAAKHLEAAGMHGQAKDLLEKAQAMERGVGREIDDLRREFEELQSENRKLQRKVDLLEQEFNEFRERPVFRFTR